MPSTPPPAHHAYLMDVDFGMQFEMWNGLGPPEGLLRITAAGGYRIEAEEESMHLQEPQVGDVLSSGKLIAASFGSKSTL